MNKNSERLIIGVVALLAGLLLGWMVRGVSTYNIHSAAVAIYDDWRVACPAAETKEGACELSTDIMDRTQPQPTPIARATITTDKDGKKIMGFILPYGVALEAGMGLRVGKDPVKVIQYRTCNTVGCIAQTPFDDAMATSLKNNTDDVAVMFAGLDGKPVTYPLSFKGYAKSYSAWKGDDARRKTWFWRLFS